MLLDGDLIEKRGCLYCIIDLLIYFFVVLIFHKLGMDFVYNSVEKMRITCCGIYREGFLI